MLTYGSKVIFLSGASDWRKAAELVPSLFLTFPDLILSLPVPTGGWKSRWLT